ncbi:MAG: uroporphyrinogen-III synthase [Bacteroidota bacterium]|nr:uroporphyrinogen-III synthase [Bacteroidota bacterium]
MSSKIKRILVSQPKPSADKSPYFDLAEKHKLHIDFRSFIEIEGVQSKEFRQSKVDITAHTAMIFTSRTAINHFFRICEELKLNIEDSWKYFCISESVAFYLQKFIVYRKRKIFYGDGRFDDLLRLVKKHKNEKFLVPLSSASKKNIPGKLKKADVNFTPAILYKTVNADLSDLKNLNYDILVFFSPSGIQSLLHNFPDFNQNSTKIAAFGPSTHKSVKDADLSLDIKAPQPKYPSMSMALDQYIEAFNKKK